MLSKARGGGMGPAPISYSDIEAFCRLTLTPMSAWEVSVIRRVDDAALVASQEKAAKFDRNAPPEPIPTSNVKGLKALFRGLAVKKAATAKTSAPAGR